MTEVIAPLVTPARLGVATAMLAAVFAPAWVLRDDTPPPPNEVETALTDYEAAPGEQPDAALAAPLFNPERSAAEPGDNSSDAATAAPAALPLLVGVVLGGSRPAVALLKGADGQTVLARTGDIVDGWQVGKIDRTGAALAQGTRIERVVIDYRGRDSAPSANPPSAPPGAPPGATPIGVALPPPPGQ